MRKEPKFVHDLLGDIYYAALRRGATVAHRKGGDLSTMYIKAPELDSVVEVHGVPPEEREKFPVQLRAMALPEEETKHLTAIRMGAEVYRRYVGSRVIQERVAGDSRFDTLEKAIGEELSEERWVVKTGE